MFSLKYLLHTTSLLFSFHYFFPLLLVHTNNILRKVAYLVTEIWKHGLAFTLSDYIECLYQEQIRDIQEIKEGR